MMGDAINELAGVAASDFRVDMARASAARGVLPGVRTSSSSAVSVRLGVAGASAVGGCCDTSLLDERLRDIFLVGFGVVGLEAILAIFAAGASAGAEELLAEELAVELAAEDVATDALRDLLSSSIARMMSCASNELAFTVVLPVRIVDNLSKLLFETLVFKKSFHWRFLSDQFSTSSFVATPSMPCILSTTLKDEFEPRLACR